MADSTNKSMNAAATFCGAKTTNGGACKRRPVPGKRRCKLHGGNNTGAPKGNQNAVKTGERAKASLFRDLLDEDEQAMWDGIDTEKRHQLQEEIKLLTMRERFMLQRIKDLKAKGEFSLYERSVETSSNTEEGRDRNGQLVGVAQIKTASKTVETKRANLERIQAIEEALTRVQNSKAKAIELLIKLDEGQQPNLGDTVQKFLDALDGKVAEVWADHEEEGGEDAEEEEAGT